MLCTQTRFTVASGGHHLPLCRRADGTFETLGASGTILGLLDAPRLSDTTAVLRQGDVTVLYTDGVTEARWSREFFDDDRLRAVIDRCVGLTAQETADAVVGAALDFQDGEARDDMAVVVIGVRAG
ncbi:MAG: PP2C family protein-serine/threonine phosphatase [Acidimicrobiales bacterium]